MSVEWSFVLWAREITVFWLRRSALSLSLFIMKHCEHKKSRLLACCFGPDQAVWFSNSLLSFVCQVRNYFGESCVSYSFRFSLLKLKDYRIEGGRNDASMQGEHIYSLVSYSYVWLLSRLFEFGNFNRVLRCMSCKGNQVDFSILLYL